MLVQTFKPRFFCIGILGWRVLGCPIFPTLRSALDELAVPAASMLHRMCVEDQGASEQSDEMDDSRDRKEIIARQQLGSETDSRPQSLLRRPRSSFFPTCNMAYIYGGQNITRNSRGV